MSTAKELRARARESLGGKIFKRGWLYPLLALLIISILTSAVSSIPYGIGLVITLVVTGPLSVGLATYFLKRSRKECKEEDLTHVFTVFKNDPANSIFTGILVTIFTFLWSLLLIVPGFIKTFSYSMAYYIKADHPEYTAEQAITASREMMDGNKLRLFCLYLSFIGWYFVGFLTLGIGLLWVQPYVSAAVAEFYRELRGDFDFEAPLEGNIAPEAAETFEAPVAEEAVEAPQTAETFEVPVAEEAVEATEAETSDEI